MANLVREKKKATSLTSSARHLHPRSISPITPLLYAKQQYSRLEFVPAVEAKLLLRQGPTHRDAAFVSLPVIWAFTPPHYLIQFIHVSRKRKLSRGPG